MVPVVAAGAVAAKSAAVEGAMALVPLFDKLISAYTEKKRLDVELAKIEAEDRLAEREYELRRKALDAEFKLQKQRLDKICEKVEAQIDVLKAQSKKFCQYEDQLRRKADVLFDLIVDDRRDSGFRSQMMEFWERIQERISSESDKMTMRLSQSVADNVKLLAEKSGRLYIDQQ